MVFVQDDDEEAEAEESDKSKSEINDDDEDEDVCFRTNWPEFYFLMLTVDCCLNFLWRLALVNFAGVLTCFGVDNDVVQEDEDLED
jgi:hypothetical protein